MSIHSISQLHPNVVFRNKERSLFPSVVSRVLDKYFNKLYQNQVSFGKNIADKFLDRTVHTILAVALTQSGKTGSMLAVIYNFISSPALAIPLQNVFIITGHSSSEWVLQTRERFPKCMANNIYHRNRLSQFSKKMLFLTNALIIIDETQVASSNCQSIKKSLLAAGITDDTLFCRDIKFLLVSATPNSSIKKFIPERRGYSLLYMLPAIGYKSIFDMVQTGHVFQCKDLCGFDKVTNTVLPHVLDNIKEIRIPVIPKYHIIRTHHSFMHDITINNFKAVFKHTCFYKSMPDLDSILAIAPSKNTFIFIKETLRCAKTVDKTHLGILYERYAKYSNDSSIVQGLAGRATGYHSQALTVFTHLPSISRYSDLWEFKFNSTLPWSKFKDSWDI